MRAGLLLLLFLPLPAMAGEAALCDAAARRAAAESGVPETVLLALTRTETGRKRGQGLEPWPWAVNQAGQGYWFPDADSALQFAEAQVAFGYGNLDIGCFQLNHRWHSGGFHSLSDMFEPMANARYAAAYLLKKYQETGDWTAAAGAYHSGTEVQAERYRARFEIVMADLGRFDLAALEPPGQPRANSYPLLRGGGGGGLGSLMPRVAGRASLFAALP
ncbi:MAG: transglycosylase SLT domain-containing protein [Gemmobacter sp.]|jgi:hypothetical protein|nr:transglycosylase SLT domain-containing protein [Gemmobacter sp.]